MKRCCEHVSLVRTGFTLVELAVVVAMVGSLATMLAPTMARTKPNSASLQCQNNLRQLAFAWKMYADESNGNLVYNRDGMAGYSAGNETWVGGWLDNTPFGSDATNAGLLIDHSKYPYCAFLGPYIKTPLPFKCPADRSALWIEGRAMPRVRSVSMNNYVGTGSRTWTSPSRYALCTRFEQIKLPGYLFVFLDEREDCINDGSFATDPDTRYQLIDYPASYHNNGGGFCFADGHSEIHRWKDRRTMPVLSPGQLLMLNVNQPGNMDMLWLAQHAAAAASYP